MNATKEWRLIIRKWAPSIAVVVCTNNRPTTLERCLERLRQVDHPAFSIVVVDSAPNSSEAKQIAARYGAQYHVSPLKGVSRARNIGTRATEVDIIAYLDDDMIPHACWLDSLILEFADKDVMAATGPVLALDFLEAKGADLRRQIELKPWGPHPFQIDQSSRHWFERANFGGVGDGNFALRRSVFEQISGFEERLGRGAKINSGEEHYAFFRVIQLGFRIAYAPQAIVFHPLASPSPDVLRQQLAETVAFSAFLAWNHPSKVWRIAKFLCGGVFKIRRWWHATSKYELNSISTIEKFLCGVNGLSIFFKSARYTCKGTDPDRKARATEPTFTKL